MAALTRELVPLVPAPFEVAADGSAFVVFSGGHEDSRTRIAAIVDEDDGRSIEQRMATAARSILSHLQDVVANATRLPWPGGGVELPLPDAEVRAGELHAWFGAPDAPAMSLTPVSVVSAH